MPPKYLTLAEKFARQIHSGQLAPGDRLPSFTQMRAQWGATPATVERIHARLERENLIEQVTIAAAFSSPMISPVAGTRRSICWNWVTRASRA